MWEQLTAMSKSEYFFKIKMYFIWISEFLSFRYALFFIAILTRKNHDLYEEKNTITSNSVQGKKKGGPGGGGGLVYLDFADFFFI